MHLKICRCCCPFLACFVLIYCKLHITLHYFTTPLTPKVTSGASTKSYMSFIGELKQVSFQLFFKSISVRFHAWRLEGSEFHAFGPAYEELRSPNLSFSFGVSYRKLMAERSLSRPGRSSVAVIMSARYAGLRPTRTRCISTHSLYCIRSLIGSQCRLLRTGVM